MAFEDHRVSLAKCDDYDPHRVMEAVRRTIDLLGGLDRFVRPGQSVLVKPNLLLASPPEKCVTTDPEIVGAVATLLREHGCEVVIADSAGGNIPFTGARLQKLYDVTGMTGAAERSGASLGTDASYTEVANPDGQVVKRFQIIRAAAEADAIVVVSKAKTHVLTTMTGATKCLFGVLPGMEKPSFHGRLSDVEQFSEMLLDLNLALIPRLQVMDAVMGMEGEGPSGGQPRKIGAILASGNPVALDVVAARLMALRPEDIPTIRKAVERGIIPRDLGVEVLGDDLATLVVPDFEHPTPLTSRLGVGAPVLGRLLRAYALRPVVSPEKCTGCQACVGSCPQQTIRMVRGKARVKHGNCIRCYCCHEMCQSKAIGLTRSFGGRMIARIMESPGPHR
jgi:uncharacterized protein (DUF362 family)/ferredoxin